MAMANRIDILVDADGIVCTAGDFAIGASDNQHVEHIILTLQGNWRRTPLVGLAAQRVINLSTDALKVLSFKRSLKIQLENDGYNLKSSALNKDGKLIVDYE